MVRSVKGFNGTVKGLIGLIRIVIAFVIALLSKTISARTPSQGFRGTISTTITGIGTGTSRSPSTSTVVLV